MTRTPSPPPKPPVWHRQLQAAWLSGSDPRYKELQEACAAVEDAALKYDSVVPQDLLPAAWVSARNYSTNYNSISAVHTANLTLSMCARSA